MDMLSENQKEKIWQEVVENFDVSIVPMIMKEFRKILDVVNEHKSLIYKHFYQIKPDYLSNLMRSLNQFLASSDFPSFCLAIEMISLMIFPENSEIVKLLAKKEVVRIDILPMLFILDFDLNNEAEFYLKKEFTHAFVTQKLYDEDYKVNVLKKVKQVNSLIDMFPSSRVNMTNLLTTMILCDSVLDPKVFRKALDTNKPLYIYLEKQHMNIFTNINPDITDLMNKIILEYNFSNSSMDSFST